MSPVLTYKSKNFIRPEVTGTQKLLLVHNVSLWVLHVGSEDTFFDTTLSGGFSGDGDPQSEIDCKRPDIRI